MASFLNTLFGSPSQIQQLPILSPQQLQAQQGLLQSGQQQLQNNPLSFDPIEKRAIKQFEEQTIPTLAERFTSMGGGQRSSAFKGALGNVSQDFGERLAALRSQYGLQANQQGFQQLMAGLQPEFQNILQPRQSGLLENLVGPIAQGLGNYGTLGVSGALGNLFGQKPQQQDSEVVTLLQKLISLLGGR